jgi:hypothetical protein
LNTFLHQSNQIKQRFGISQHDSGCGHVGNIEQSKGITKLNMMDPLQTYQLDLQTTIAGTSENKSMLQNFVLICRQKKQKKFRIRYWNIVDRLL